MSISNERKEIADEYNVKLEEVPNSRDELNEFLKDFLSEKIGM